ncbi:RNA-dependent RNA polymerase [Erysiphe necator associated narnavirus 11]|nr:RNA-dependent RNA polymerase [Erysiphe necator associated narnavirus 11]
MSSSGSYQTARTGSSSSYASAAERQEVWDIRKDVLCTSSFPCTSTLRKVRSGCECSSHHRSLQDFCKLILDPSLRKNLDVPKINVCWDAVNLWEEKLPVELTGLDKRIKFERMPSIWHAQKVLYSGTYWFRRLMRKESTGRLNPNGVAVLRLLSGKSSFSGPEEVWQLVKQKISHGGIQKLRNILATVDGMLMQIVLSFPLWEDLLDWSRIDQIVHCLICQLLPDYFRGDTEKISCYEKIKKLRKAIKELGFNPIGNVSSIDIPREISFMKVIVDFIADRKTPIDLYRVSLLSQTRAAGVPPQSVYLSTLREIKEILTEPPDHTAYERVKVYIRDGVDMLHQEIVESIGSEKQSESFWSRVINKAKVSLSDSGEFFTNSESGGKLEAARKILSKNLEIQELNLESGFPTGKILTGDDSPGERLFHWACGLFLDRKTVYDRNVMSVRVSLVSELGKYRAITVSHLGHAILLHVLSHVLLEYISIVPSSRSGVGAANHAWNFFKRLSHKNPSANFIFGDGDVFLFSTDWKQATNYCDHAIAQAMINRLCYNLGIPNWYRQVSMFALCAPRQVEEIDHDSKTLSCYFTTRGELMGDPVVKVILHCYHLVARYSAQRQIRAMARTA